MYATKDFKTKKALKEAIAAGERIKIFSPAAPVNEYLVQNGETWIEGPHYNHKWYATVQMEDGYIKKVK